MEISEPKYSSKVRVGKWYDALCLEEAEVQEFLKKRSQNQLMIQKMRLLKQNFYKKLALSPFSPTIRFGMSLQIQSANANAHVRLYLSIGINENMLTKSQNISDKCELTVAPSEGSCTRNSFVIESGDKLGHFDEPLRYGQDFKIRCFTAEEEPLYVYSISKSADLGSLIANRFSTYNRGEINLSVGLILERNTGVGSLIPEACTRWRCLHIDPDKRFESEGTPVPSNTELLIVHTATNRNLAVENVRISTLFGPEYLVSAQTYLNNHLIENWPNIWMLAVGQTTN